MFNEKWQAKFKPYIVTESELASALKENRLSYIDFFDVPLAALQDLYPKEFDLLLTLALDPEYSETVHEILNDEASRTMRQHLLGYGILQLSESKSLLMPALKFAISSYGKRAAVPKIPRFMLGETAKDNAEVKKLVRDMTLKLENDITKAVAFLVRFDVDLPAFKDQTKVHLDKTKKDYQKRLKRISEATDFYPALSALTFNEKKDYIVSKAFWPRFGSRMWSDNKALVRRYFEEVISARNDASHEDDSVQFDPARFSHVKGLVRLLEQPILEIQVRS